MITRYNRSPMYARAVHELAQAIAARVPPVAPVECAPELAPCAAVNEASAVKSDIR